MKKTWRIGSVHPASKTTGIIHATVVEDTSTPQILIAYTADKYMNLIAAAPDLLYACEQAMKAFEYNWCIDWLEVENAIKKAKGEL